MDYSMAGTAQLIQDALQQGIKPQLPLADLLVGYSMGGRLALYLGLRFPQSFPQAQIISGSPGLMNQKERKSRQEEDLNRCREIKSNLKVFLSLWYQQPLFASLWKTSAVEAMLAQRLRNNPDEICLSLEHLGLGSQPSLWEELPNSQANLHQIVGELDSKFVAIAQEMRRWNPNLDLRVIPDVGHNIPLENPASIVAEIRRVMA
jgi:2-succinyl-6-hydroxy-2,4-cyclohexadiene-1-carboxylate synthase